MSAVDDARLPIEQFRDAMRATGLDPSVHIEPDGELHRFPTNGKPRDDSGWYVYYGDGIPAGAFGCWRQGINETWSARKPAEMTPAERAQYRRSIADAQRQRDAERERRQAEACERAERVWREAQPESGNHRYLRGKEVNAYGLRTDGYRLIIPMRDTDGTLRSLQFIDPYGAKRFIKAGRKSGCYHSIGKLGGVVCICEGYATGASVHEATGHAVAVAFDSGNLLPVATALCAKHPAMPIVICADDDYRTQGNPGLTAATAAGRAVGGLLAVPDFGDERPEGATDMNDLHSARGAEAVRAAVAHAKAPADGANENISSCAPTKAETTWPDKLADQAFHGLAGEVVKTISPHSEADPAALLVQFLAAFGSCVGRGPYYQIEGDEHAANIFEVLVGDTSKGRKGTSWGRVRQPFDKIGDRWAAERVQTGLSSGEGLIWAVRDPIYKREKRGKGAAARYENVEADAGVSDKRLLVIEPEFASTLRVMGRDGNTLSPIIRQAWDRGDLRAMTKNSPATATDAHISIIGHITADELRRYLDRTEVGNGFANRFLFVCVRRSKCLPEGGNLNADDLTEHARPLALAVGDARKLRRVVMDDAARVIWREVYPVLSEGLPGLLGAVTSRAEAQVVRLALLYALLDKADKIGAPHLQAALAVWDYAEASARHVFGSAVGDPVADDILRALRANPGGLTRTDISNLFRRHKEGQTIGRALELLQKRGLARTEQRKTDGRPVEVWFSC